MQPSLDICEKKTVGGGESKHSPLPARSGLKHFPILLLSRFYLSLKTNFSKFVFVLLSLFVSFAL